MWACMWESLYNGLYVCESECVCVCLFVCICIWTCQNCSLSAPLSRFDQSISPGYDNRASVTSKPQGYERQLYQMNIKSVLVWLLLHLYFKTTKRDLIGGLRAAAEHCNSLTIIIMDIGIWKYLDQNFEEVYLFPCVISIQGDLLTPPLK